MSCVVVTPEPSKSEVHRNSAVIVTGSVALNAQFPAPVHVPPDQPANTEFPAAAADSTTPLPTLNDAWHVWPQESPAGALVTIPDPEPTRATVICTVGGTHGLGVQLVESPWYTLVPLQAL